MGNLSTLIVPHIIHNQAINMFVDLVIIPSVSVENSSAFKILTAEGYEKPVTNNGLSGSAKVENSIVSSSQYHFYNVTEVWKRQYQQRKTLTNIHMIYS